MSTMEGLWRRYVQFRKSKIGHFQCVHEAWLGVFLFVRGRYLNRSLSTIGSSVFGSVNENRRHRLRARRCLTRQNSSPAAKYFHVLTRASPRVNLGRSKIAWALPRNDGAKEYGIIPSCCLGIHSYAGALLARAPIQEKK